MNQTSSRLPRYLSAEEAARALGVTRQTLYAYASRGQIRSEQTQPGPTRNRRYSGEDVLRLIERKKARRDPGRVARGALHWGAPVLESAISLIADGRLYYRGREAVELARHHTVEEVAALIWTDDDPGDGRGADDERVAHEASATPASLVGTVGPLITGLSAVAAFQVIIPMAAASDPTGYDRRPRTVARTGARILQLLAETAARRAETAEPLRVAETLRRGWVPSDSDAERLISAALILCADHELNVSAFAARCVASAGSTPYAAVLAGLAALQGVKHGGYTDRVTVLLDEVSAGGSAQKVIADRLRRGDEIPGFGHPLYPDGDPRGRTLLDLVSARYPGAPAVELSRETARAVQELIGEFPTIDLGLVTLARAMDLPSGIALTLFAIGRTIGWIGHAIEQYESDRLIRPRARYVGRVP